MVDSQETACHFCWTNIRSSQQGSVDLACTKTRQNNAVVSLSFFSNSCRMGEGNRKQLIYDCAGSSRPGNLYVLLNSAGKHCAFQKSHACRRRWLGVIIMQESGLIFVSG